MRAAILCLILGLALQVQAQKSTSAKAGSYLDMPWKVVATRMSNDWYASDSARRVAETVLFCQQDIGGWAKNKPYHHPLTDSAKAAIEKSRSRIGATIDNGSTTTEMKFLVKMYNATKEPRYYLAFEKALEYLLAAQYPNGGWPQYYPFRKGSTAYASHITYNDNAMVNVLEVLRDIAEEKPYYAQLPVTPALRARAKQAYDKGIECILKTQITVSGRPTVWCAQHDEATLLPAKARAYELPSFSGQESVGIVHLLMQVKNPSDRIIAEAIKDKDVDVIINVQGDTPFVQAEPLRKLIALFQDPAVQVASLMDVIGDEASLHDPNVVKVVVDKHNNSLLFSRSVIPYPRSTDIAITHYRHIGVYAYRKDTLLQFTQWPITPLEDAEKIECLRYLENGVQLRMALTPPMGIDINTPEDLERAQAHISKEGF